MNQKEAVVSTLLGILAERNIEYVMKGDVRLSDVLTDSDKKAARDALFFMFRNGDVAFKTEATAKKHEPDSELKKYVSGLVNNWVRKNPDFNCGEIYKAQNPGSRAHVGDEQLKALKALSARYANDEEAMKGIAEAIVKRKAEVDAEKAEKVEISIDSLPEALRHLVK